MESCAETSTVPVVLGAIGDQVVTMNPVLAGLLSLLIFFAIVYFASKAQGD